MKEGLPLVDRHKVVVLSITYNHSQYIEETLKGFAMQQTDFPFLCCVFDDASTDGEQEILKRWIDEHCHHDDVEVYDHPLTIVLKAPDKTNPNCIYAIHLQKVNTWGKPEKKKLLTHWQQAGEYIAMCEGDDYWLDPLKLQKQVDFLESHPDYVMCCSDAKIIVGNKVLDWERYSKSQQVPVKDVILGGGLFVQTASLLYRSLLINSDDYPEAARKCHVGDYPLQIFAALKGEIYWFAEKQVAYRYQSANSWTKNNSKLSVAEQISGWKSEIEMLDSMDLLSSKGYSRYFTQRKVDFIYRKHLLYPKHHILLERHFGDITCQFSIKQRVFCFIAATGILEALRVIKNGIRRIVKR